MAKEEKHFIHPDEREAVNSDCRKDVKKEESSALKVKAKEAVIII